MNDTTKLTWAQLYQAQAKAEAEAQVEERVKELFEKRIKQIEERTIIETFRRVLINLLSDANREMFESLVTSVHACEDVDRLQAAIVKSHTWKSLADLKF